jgi:hypothetical protein
VFCGFLILVELYTLIVYAVVSHGQDIGMPSAIALVT